MSSLLKRGFTLSFSRLANQAILVFSPIILVRLISVSEYGGYREFVLYSSIITSVITFGVPNSLQYFVPKYPEKVRIWITQTVLIALGLTAVASLGVWLAADIVRTNTSLDFILALQLYVFFSANLNYLEFYWLGKKRTDYVLYFSTGRLLIRVVVLVAAALYSPTAFSLIYALVWLEVARFCIVLVFSVQQKLFSTQITKSTLQEQATYFVPLGFGGMVQMISSKIGPLFVAIGMGAEMLALFVIGGFAVPIVNIFKGAIGDVIFPDIVELRTAEPADALPLWRKATILYCVLMLPTACLLMFYSSDIVRILFTAEYSRAAPVFVVFAAMLCVSCFEFHLPLRVQNANRYFVTGNIIALSCNALMLYPLSVAFGLIGPAIAFVISQSILAVHLGRRVSLVYKVRVPELLDWSAIARIVVVVIACLPLLMLTRSMIENSILQLFAGSALYLFVYFFLIRTLGIWDALHLVQRLLRPVTSIIQRPRK